MTCHACPFSGSDAAESAINLGCLPGEGEIMQAHYEGGGNWACHENEDRICAGFASVKHERGEKMDKAAPLMRPSDY
jgi:hypothetical protein